VTGGGNLFGVGGGKTVVIYNITTTGPSSSLSERQEVPDKESFPPSANFPVLIGKSVLAGKK